MKTFLTSVATSVIAAVATAVLALVVFIPPSAEARTRYCTHNGTMCQTVDKSARSVVFRWQTFHHRGGYELCVGPRGGGVTCVTRDLHRVFANIYRGNVRFKSSFRHRRSGPYTVSWYQGGERIGRTLRFRHLHRRGSVSSKA